MRLLVTFLLCAVAVAGCLSDDDPGDDPDPTSTATGPPRTQTFHPTATATGTTTTTTSPTSQAPGMPQFVYTGHTGAEPNMGITSSGNIFVTAFEETLRSSDGGLSWEVVHTYSFGQGLSGVGTSDPMMWVDTDTDRVYVNHMLSTQCFNMLWSDDEGATWTQRDLACIIPLVDHQKIMTSKPGPDPNPQAMRLGSGPGQYPNVLYTCYNAAVGNQCFASFDGGLTYTQESVSMGSPPLGPGGDCSGVGGHPAAAPDGTIAVAAGWNCGPTVSHSTDSGLTWTVHDGPTEHGVGASIDPDLSFTPDGTLYMAYRDGDHRTRLGRTSDYGATWDAAWDITAPGLTSTRFHVVSTGSDGRVAVAYIGTDHPLGTTWDNNGQEETWEGAPIDAPPDATWHLYIVTSEDAGSDAPSFTAYRVTPDDDPVQVGCAWEGGGGGGDRTCRNMLDFIDSAVAPDGTFYTVYTEGCTVREGCAPFEGEPPEESESRDREIAVAWLDGWSLYA